MVEFTGKVNGIVFENNRDMFKILDVEILGKLDDYDEQEIKVTGNFGEIDYSSSYHFEGQLVMHEKFGLQFRATSYQQVMPHEVGGLVKYFSSDKFPGIGQKSANTIVDELGLDALDILKDNPDKIKTLSLSTKQKKSLLSGISAMDSYAEVALKLTQYGIRRPIANRIYQIYRGEAIEKLQTDPYSPISEVHGYGFKSADLIGKELDIPKDDSRRIKGAIFQILSDKLQNNGDTYVELEELLTEANELLKINSFDLIANNINDLQHADKIIVDDNKASLQNIFKTESDIAQIMKDLVKKKNITETFSNEDIQQAIEEAEQELKIKYDDTQKAAIKNALNNPISILTGGPGTGKTTIINGILISLRKLAAIPASALYSDDPPFLLAAPTGRAAKRMSEITGIAAKTIHRMLGIGIGNNEDEELNELNGEILIIDEMSMVDMFLFKKLISSINDTVRVVFVGDKDQLPSVGAGNVFSDLIKSEAFPTTILKQIHRQGDDSTIITLAHSVNEGNNQEEIFKKTKNYSFIPCRPDLVGDAVGQIVELAIKKGFSKDDIQVLGAMYNGNGGVNNLNDIIQEIMNPAEKHTKKIEAHNEIFRIGDRVLQLQNNPEKDIYNGQIGKVVGIDEENAKRCLITNFDDREVSFSKKDLSDLTRAYAITIHKSQGSEFPLVVLNLTMQNYVMLKRNLLYTAITRAEKNLVLIGDPRAYQAALNTPGNDRKTTLAEKLHQILKVSAGKNLENESKLNSQDYHLTPELIYSGQIDPMIGMEGVKLKGK
ncbi:ATP-dependent RecD-like DNA helicase [Lactobacillus sp. LL6]|uniref:SF1B family DNA helicase RecD2 n=1 Tax=Lactobacillus sp. LL6 TaxID=2596827 RepID=UPI0011848FAA|nr:ATP-dependent RecD-like DNA helicase [Lactobacillus sp. LL6]TSO26183.1 ATP-dependent RecD-like DNA helicase [Lactobacillus sp. LL6]